MYSAQQLYYQGNPLVAVLKKIGDTITDFTVCFDQAVRAARIAETEPIDLEAIRQILNEK